MATRGEGTTETVLTELFGPARIVQVSEPDCVCSQLALDSHALRAQLSKVRDFPVARVVNPLTATYLWSGGLRSR